MTGSARAAGRLPLVPVEGWVTVVLTVVLCATLAWSLDDARWVLGRETYLDFLPVVAAAGVLVGFAGPKLGWGRWTTHLIGAVFAALIVPLFAASVTFPDGASFGELYRATATSVVAAYGDIVIRNQASTIQYLHYLLSLGLFVWGTSQFASYAVFGHHRPLSAVTVVGLLLLGNMSLTFNDQLVFLVVFSLAALLMLIRGHVLEEQSEWLRRRIGDPASIASVYLRGGTVFIAIAVAGALFLTQTAASAPLAGAWDGLNDSLVSVSRALQRFLPAGGANRSLGVSFGPTAAIQQVWTTDSSLAVTIQLSPRDTGGEYWRAVTYDRIELTGWSMTSTAEVRRAAGAPLFEGLADNVGETGRKVLAFTVIPADFRGSSILSPATPINVDENTRVTVLEPGGFFSAIDRDGGDGSYSVTALVQVNGEDPGQINQAGLRAAGSTYPQEIRDLYLGVAEGQLGPFARELENQVIAQSPSREPYDLAATLVEILHGETYRYDTDLRELDCAGVSTVECFAQFKRGFCQQYAATMAVIMRDLGVPTRIAQGFLPGAFDAQTGRETIPNSNAHAWVEVYFPGYGWVTFDPTGGGVAALAPLPSGNPGASLPPNAGVPTIPRVDGRDPLEIDPGSGLGGGSTNRGSLGPFIAVTVLLVLMVGAIAFAVWRRGPRGETNADRAYGGVARLAARFGFGPRPTETVYEYAGALGDELPTVRPELQTVARAKVETTYGRQVLGEERLAALQSAQRRLRVALLRLVFRRKRRR